MDLTFWFVILVLLAMQLPFWWLIWLIEKHTWNKGVSRTTGKPWKYIKSVAYGCQHNYEAGEHKETFSFRFDK